VLGISRSPFELCPRHLYLGTADTLQQFPCLTHPNPSAEPKVNRASKRNRFEEQQQQT
jgi:hypothetical protein